ncbi:MAG TPA: 4a-hydroxytetrahydrobiopterin dehydratase [Gaiellaceae bacterium]|nr:4a-hydroxytetrahydrobiopterin dehydratase [Gaiellaceae bacterium]
MTVSVVIPTCRRPQALLRALRGLLAQELADWEAIVVDDGGGEGIEAARGLGDPRIGAVANEGRGQVDARSTAIGRARGELLCWLDDDDWWDDPHHLSLLAAAAAEDARSFFHRGGWIVHEPDGRREVFDHDATPASLRVNNTILTSSLAYRRELHDRLGPLDRELGSYGDWDFVLRMCDAGLVPRKLPGLGVCYAVHGGNVSAAVDAPARLAGFRRLVAKHGLDTEIHSHVTMHRMLSAPEGWSEVGGKLEREFAFGGFREAVAFVNRVAELAESENHHPDIDLRYSKVVLRWWTHTAGGVTDRDRELAERSAGLA